MDTQYYTEHVAVDSSAMTAITYDADSKRLFVHFLSGSKAAYDGVGQAMFNEFKNATSKGAFYARYIKPVYKGINSDVHLVERKANLAGVYAQAAVETSSTIGNAARPRYSAVIEFVANDANHAFEILNDIAVDYEVEVTGVLKTS